MSELLLTGLDGKNPLAFLAALGVLDALSERSAHGAAPRLAWRYDGVYRPVLVGGPDRDALVPALLDDLRAFRDEPALALRYAKKGEGAEAWDLKPPPGEYRKYLERLVAGAAPGRRRSVDHAAAFATDVACDNNGNTKPTALHFTAGQQEFLKTVGEVMEGTRAEDLDEALFGPWRYRGRLKTLGWDNTAARDYALRADDPSKAEKLGVPGADWLAFRGLAFLRCAPRGDEILTTGCSGGWKTGAFRWPVWSAPLPRSVVRSLLASTELVACRPDTLRARGVDAVFESSIKRSDQGGYGSFSPARIAAPVDV